MKRHSVLIFAILVLLTATVAFGADLTLTWNPSDRATGYKVYMSTDTGGTWTENDVLNVTSYLWAGVPDSGLVLFKVRAYNAVGDSEDSGKGAWWNGDWTPPATTIGLSLE